MNVYLVQHALSKNKEEDPERGITGEGREETIKIAAFLARLDLDIPSLWHSGKKRALQTAEILAEHLGDPQMMEHRDLNPMDSVLSLKQELESEDKNIMIVGHLPSLSNLLGSLISKEGEIVKFRNSAVTCLERSNDSWRILWSVVPELL